MCLRLVCACAKHANETRGVVQDLVKNYAITESQCKPSLESENPNAVLRLFDRALCAANMRIMMSASGATPAPAAQAVAPSTSHMDTEVPVVPVAASARTSQKRKIDDVDTDNSPEAILSRAMANTFEVY